MFRLHKKFPKAADISYETISVNFIQFNLRNSEDIFMKTIIPDVNPKQNKEFLNDSNSFLLPS